MDNWKVRWDGPASAGVALVFPRAASSVQASPDGAGPVRIARAASVVGLSAAQPGPLASDGARNLLGSPVEIQEV